MACCASDRPLFPRLYFVIIGKREYSDKDFHLLPLTSALAAKLDRPSDVFFEDEAEKSPPRLNVKEPLSECLFLLPLKSLTSLTRGIDI